MYSQQSKCKWKQVLGFDDGLPLRSDSSIKLASPQIFQLFGSQSQPAYPQLPKDITFSRLNGDIVLNPSSVFHAPFSYDGKPLPRPSTLFYITLRDDHSVATTIRRPEIILHSGADQASPIVSFAKVHPGNEETYITLCPPTRKPLAANLSRNTFLTSPSLTSPFSSSASFVSAVSSGSSNSLASLWSRAASVAKTILPASLRSSKSSLASSASTCSREEMSKSKFRRERLSHSGSKFTTDKYAFGYTNQQTFVREKFEWRYASRRLSRHSDVNRATDAMRLVRTSTREIVAIYAGMGSTSLKDNPREVMGLFRFLRGEAHSDLEEDFEIFAVMSLLSIVEEKRRMVYTRNNRFEGD